jgi:hypothetical protein
MARPGIAAIREKAIRSSLRLRFRTASSTLEVAGRAADYRMIGIATKPDPSCSGHDLLEIMATQ